MALRPMEEGELLVSSIVVSSTILLLIYPSVELEEEGEDVALNHHSFLDEWIVVEAEIEFLCSSFEEN